jgi:hypothetical protein
MAAEGIICIVLASPLVLFLSALGSVAGYFVQDRIFSKSKTLLCALVLVNPFVLGAESIGELPFAEETVETELVVPASAERVWSVLDHPIELSQETAWLEHFGFTVPRSAELVRGVAPRLDCTFASTAVSFPVDELREGTLVRFAPRTNTPDPMRETGIVDEIRAPHLSGYFTVETGEISVVPRDEGHATLKARTTFVHRISPSWYWRWWTSTVIDQLHHSVLRAIATRAEARTR